MTPAYAHVGALVWVPMLHSTQLARVVNVIPAAAVGQGPDGVPAVPLVYVVRWRDNAHCWSIMPRAVHQLGRRPPEARAARVLRRAGYAPDVQVFADGAV